MRYWQNELFLIITLLSLTTFIGWLLDYSLVFLFLGVITYLVWHLWQLHRLDQWLLGDRKTLLPESYGIWGQIFDSIYTLQRRNRKRKKRLRQLLDQFQHSIAALPDGIIALNAQGHITWWNQAATRFFGFKAPQDVDQPITNLIRDPRFNQFFYQTSYEGGIQLIPPLHPQSTLQMYITPYGDNEKLLSIRDITQIKNLETIRKNFVANVSHELRTPLTVIRGYLETLNDHAQAIEPRWSNAFKQMQQQADRMTALIDDLLLLAKLETDLSDNQKTAIDMPSLLQRIYEEALILAKTKELTIELKIESAGMLVGNEQELHSAFSNLVSNAINYTSAKGSIVIHWYKDAQGQHLEIVDTGIGIDSMHIPRLTERFYRVDSSRSLETGGTGLGLAIVKHVLLRHQAELEIRSELGKGSEFICHFPH